MASVLVLILVSLQLVAAFEPVKIPLNVITHSDSSDPKDCSLGEEITANIDNIRNVVSDILQDIHLNPKCGDGLWHRVAFLNMSDPTHQCPSAWSEYNSDGIRTCRRPTSTSGSCPGVVYNISTVECVEESLAINLEVQMPFLDLLQVLTLHEVCRSSMCGVISMVPMNREHVHTQDVHAVKAPTHHHILEITTTVSQLTLVLIAM